MNSLRRSGPGSSGELLCIDLDLRKEESMIGDSSVLSYDNDGSSRVRNYHTDANIERLLMQCKQKL